MSKRASPTIIGAFVVGAVALLVVGLVVFGSIEPLPAAPHLRHVLRHHRQWC